MNNTRTQISLAHPLLNPITIFQLNHNSHYTTLITNNTSYYHYDGLYLPNPLTTTSIHNKLREWYTTPTHIHTSIPSLQYEIPTI